VRGLFPLASAPDPDDETPETAPLADPLQTHGTTEPPPRPPAVAPGMLPLVYVAYMAVLLPVRAVKYLRLKWGFFLCDFCYLANAVVLLHLTVAPLSPRLAALSFVLADGPLAWAIYAWRTPWVFSSVELTTSVMIHLLPGLALFGNRFFPGPKGAAGVGRALWELAASPLSARPASAVATQVRETYLRLAVAPPDGTWDLSPGEAWAAMVAGPLAVYVAWQLAYWLVVQVLLLGLFKRDREYQTSFKWLTQRRSGWVIRQINRGRPRRRIVCFGLVQLMFTVVTGGLAIAVYRSFWGVLAWQAAKAAMALWFGAVSGRGLPAPPRPPPAPGPPAPGDSAADPRRHRPAPPQKYQCEAIPRKILKKALASRESRLGGVVAEDMDTVAATASVVVEATVLDASAAAKQFRRELLAGVGAG